jgi:anti-anti-sigma regulatory factor
MPPLVLDCSRLARIDYAAAMALGALLRQLAGECRRRRGDAAKRSIELRDLNHLVAALLRLLGVGDTRVCTRTNIEHSGAAERDTRQFRLVICEGPHVW